MSKKNQNQKKGIRNRLTIQVWSHYLERINALVQYGFFESRSELFRFVIDIALEDIKKKEKILIETKDIVSFLKRKRIDLEFRRL